MKEENVKSEYQRKVDKSLIPTCNIMGVNIAAINMNWLYIYSKFICKKFYFAERARRGNSGRKLIESYGVANTILYDHGGTTLDK